MCSNPRHGRCIKTCLMDEATNPEHFPAMGRCLAFGVCWLEENDQETKAAHISHKPPWGRRVVKKVVARERYGARFVMLESKERPKRLGEDSEPEGDPVRG